MTQEEKQLLVIDLCARLPYGVKVDADFYYATKKLSCDLLQDVITEEKSIRPYLRPMSSMTEEEIKTYHSYCECNDGDFTGEILYFDTIESFDYLASIHIDYRGLIEKGLALEAPEGMYEI